jgi:hypothetical protein
MKSYCNAGNVQFYENLHKRYFDKAKVADGDDNFAEMLKRGTSERSSLTLSKSRSRSRGAAKRSPTKQAIVLSPGDSNDDDPNFFDLTAKSNTMLGMSQLN